MRAIYVPEVGDVVTAVVGGVKHLQLRVSKVEMFPRPEGTPTWGFWAEGVDGWFPAESIVCWDRE